MTDADTSAVCETYADARAKLDEPTSLAIAVEVLRARQKSLNTEMAWHQTFAALSRAGLLSG